MDKEAVLDKLTAASLHPDRLFRRKGHWVARFFYFYRMGRTAWDYGTKVSRAGMRVIDANDCKHIWPDPSYFEVEFEVSNA